MPARWSCGSALTSTGPSTRPSSAAGRPAGPGSRSRPHLARAAPRPGHGEAPVRPPAPGLDRRGGRALGPGLVQHPRDPGRLHRPERGRRARQAAGGGPGGRPPPRPTAASCGAWPSRRSRPQKTGGTLTRYSGGWRSPPHPCHRPAQGDTAAYEPGGAAARVPFWQPIAPEARRRARGSRGPEATGISPSAPPRWERGAPTWRRTEREVPERWPSPKRRRSTRSAILSPRARNAASSPTRRSSRPSPRSTSRPSRWTTSCSTCRTRTSRSSRWSTSSTPRSSPARPARPATELRPQGPTNDPVRMYLKEIGKVLLTASRRSSWPRRSTRVRPPPPRSTRPPTTAASSPRPGCASSSAPSATASWPRRS